MNKWWFFKSVRYSRRLSSVFQLILGFELFDSISEFIPDPVVPNVHRHSFLDDFLVVLFDINIEHLLAVFLDLYCLRRLINNFRITNRKCAKYKSGTCRRKGSIDSRLSHYTFYVIIYNSYYFSRMPASNWFTSDNLLTGLRCSERYVDFTPGLLGYSMSRIMIELGD